MATNRKKKHRNAPNVTKISHSFIKGTLLTLLVYIGAGFLFIFLLSAIALGLEDPISYIPAFGIVSLLLCGAVGGFFCRKYFGDATAVTCSTVASALLLALFGASRAVLENHTDNLPLVAFFILSALFAGASLLGVLLGAKSGSTRRRRRRR